MGCHTLQRWFTVSLYVCLSVCLSVCMSVCVSVCLTGVPSAPTVSQTSDTAVMVRWTAVSTPHLDVMFYKVQYRRVGGRPQSRGWETVDDDIPSTKHSIRVNRLRPGH